MTQVSIVIPCICSLQVHGSASQSVERLSGLRAELEDAVSQNLRNCLVETDLDVGKRTVVSPVDSRLIRVLCVICGPHLEMLVQKGASSAAPIG